MRYVYVQYVISQVLCANKTLVDGSWVEDIIWDTSISDKEEGNRRHVHAEGRFCKLILDMYDPDVIFEHQSDSSGEEQK